MATQGLACQGLAGMAALLRVGGENEKQLLVVYIYHLFYRFRSSDHTNQGSIQVSFQVSHFICITVFPTLSTQVIPRPFMNLWPPR